MSDVNFTPNRGAYKELTPFRYWCQKVLPLVYDDSISYYELLCKVVNYLNITMEDVSTLNDDVTAMYTAYDELQDFVNQYFTDLNVQTQIDNKLDRMAADGSLNALIDPLVIDTTETSVANTLPGVVYDQLPDVVEDQIDNVVGEQIDGVVADQIQGAANNWLSANITGSNALDSTLKLYDAAARSFSAGNIIDTYAKYLGAENRITTFAAGFWENDNGTMVHPSEPNLFYQSAAVTVNPGDKYTIIAPAFTDVYNDVPRYAFTDNNYSIITTSDAAEQGAINKTITVPAGATKLVVNDNLVEYVTDSRISKMILVKGELTGTNEISDLKADLNLISEATKNLITIDDFEKTEKGISYVFDKETQQITASGTSTGSGGRNAIFNPTPITLAAGTYYLSTDITATVSPCIFIYNAPNFTMLRNGVGSFTVNEETECYLGFNNPATGTTVNDTFRVQLEAGSTKTDYIMPVSAVDRILRQTGLAYKGYLTGEITLATIKTNGIYAFAGSCTYTDFPSGGVASRGVTLVVFDSTLASGAYISQFLYTGRGDVYFRYIQKSNDTASSWVQYALEQDWSDYFKAKNTITDSTINLSTILTTGWYGLGGSYAPSDAPSGAITNAGSSLLVLAKTAASAAYITQIYIQGKPFRMWERILSSSGSVPSGFGWAEIGMQRDTPIWGKTATWYGDSTVRGQGGNGVTFPNIVSGNLALTSENMSVSGRSVCTAKADPTPMVTAISTEVVTEKDLIYFQGGTNDFWVSAPLGTIDSNDPANFYGALNTIITYLQTNFPQMCIIMGTPFKVKHTGTGTYVLPEVNQQGLKLSDYCEAIKNIGAKYGVPVIDNYNNCGIYPDNAAMFSTYMTDGVHMNANGYSKIGTFVTGQIKGLYSHI